MMHFLGKYAILYAEAKPEERKGEHNMENIIETREAEAVKSDEASEAKETFLTSGKAENPDLLAFVAEQKSHNQKMQRLMKITAGCMIGLLAVAILAAALILPRVLNILSDAQEITAQVQEIAGQAEDVLADTQQIVTQVKEGNPKKLMDSINSLAAEGEAAMQECTEQVKRAVDILDKMDIDSLNTAVDNLGKAVAPLANLFGRK